MCHTHYRQGRPVGVVLSNNNGNSNHMLNPFQEKFCKIQLKPSVICYFFIHHNLYITDPSTKEKIFWVFINQLHCVKPIIYSKKRKNKEKKAVKKSRVNHCATSLLYFLIVWTQNILMVTVVQSTLY